VAAGDFLSYKFPVWGWYVPRLFPLLLLLLLLLPRVLLLLRPPGPGLYGFGFDSLFVLGLFPTSRLCVIRETVDASETDQLLSLSFSFSF
jgi:hypothetical protein